MSNVKDDGDIGDLDATSVDNIDTPEGFPSGLGDVESDIIKRLGDLTNEEDDPYSGLMSDDLGGYYYSESYNEMRSAFDDLATGLNFKNNGSWLEEEDDGGEDLASSLDSKVNGAS
ncbi:MAG: hypothetical protein COV46_08915 [Deltaproteobacteria bacterium CG11_big_fil_rev_8_21_14_0_20_49_13]|nr:MAG: hypothetical protein COV46_08915 [Deltaproteobacteria bacterium CG11_big_fil_rev_8_21_14_0_20_49_13]